MSFELLSGLGLVALLGYALFASEPRARATLPAPEVRRCRFCRRWYSRFGCYLEGCPGRRV
jgi:hypothetical protein